MALRPPDHKSRQCCSGGGDGQARDAALQGQEGERTGFNNSVVRNLNLLSKPSMYSPNPKSVNRIQVSQFRDALANMPGRRIFHGAKEDLTFQVHEAFLRYLLRCPIEIT